MVLTLPDEFVQATQLTESELQTELALALFKQDRVTLGQASILAGVPQLDFQRLLAGRKIAIHYDAEAMDQDLERAKRLVAR